MYPGLPAANAGMKGARRVSRLEVELGDIITAINGQDIRSNDDYLSAMENYKPGDSVTIRTRRKDQDMSFEVTLVESQ